MTKKIKIAVMLALVFMAGALSAYTLITVNYDVNEKAKTGGHEPRVGDNGVKVCFNKAEQLIIAH